jgi:hypothetical protein
MDDRRLIQTIRKTVMLRRLQHGFPRSFSLDRTIEVVPPESIAMRNEPVIGPQGDLVRLLNRKRRPITHADPPTGLATFGGLVGPCNCGREGLNLVSLSGSTCQ